MRICRIRLCLIAILLIAIFQISPADDKYSNPHPDPGRSGDCVPGDTKPNKPDAQSQSDCYPPPPQNQLNYNENSSSPEISFLEKVIEIIFIFFMK